MKPDIDLQRAAEELLVLASKLETLNGDEYWKSLYQFKKMAIDLSETIIQKANP